MWFRFFRNAINKYRRTRVFITRGGNYPLPPKKKHPLPNHPLPKTRATEETCWEYMCERVCRGEEMRSGMWDWRVEGEVGLRGWRVAPAFTSRSVNARLVVANRKGDTCNMFLSIVRPLDFFLFWGFALFSLIFFFFLAAPCFVVFQPQFSGMCLEERLKGCVSTYVC